MATETITEKVVMQDHEIDPLTRIESDIYAREKLTQKRLTILPLSDNFIIVVRGVSSARAPALEAGCRGFKSSPPKI